MIKSNIIYYKDKIIKLLLIFYSIGIILCKLNIINGEYYNLRQIINQSIEYGFYNINLTFLKTIHTYIESGNLKPLIVNFLSFIPFGAVFYFKVFKIKFLNYFFVPFFIILLEFIQFIFRVGFFDIDIIFLNLLGYLFGCILFYCLGILIYKILNLLKINNC